MGRHGVAGVATPPQVAAAKAATAPALASEPVTTASESHAGSSAGTKQNLSAQAGKPWPIPRRRFEMSTLFVAEFACMLLIAPFYLILGHGSQLYSLRITNAAVFHTATTQSVEAIELVLGILAMLALPFFPRHRRATFMVAMGLGILAMVFFLARQQGQLMVILVGYPAVALLSLVALDALTGIRPAAADSETFNTRQFIMGAAVTILWFLPTVELFTCRTVDSIVSSDRSPWLHLTLAIAMLGAQGAGIIALAGYFSRFNRWVNITGRLCGTLALTITMGMGLWSAMANSELIGADQQWLHPELLWIFMLISAALLLVWSGLTQKFILTAALERGEAEA
jgi:hypothetical protein